ncbi:MAG: inner membrane CreD family protein, partial [Cocleimonas sp.]
MEIIFGLIGLCFLVVIFAGFVFLAIFLARKIGLLKTIEIGEDGEQLESSSQNYKKSISAYASDFKKLSDSLVFRFITIAVLIGLMMLPLNMVSDIVSERSRLYHNVLNDISATWGQQQNLQGPSLFIPYTEKFVTEEIKTDKDGNERKVNKIIFKHRTAIVLPDDLDIDVNLNGESRKRSIYEALVYTAEVKVSGKFKRPDITKLSNNINEIHWSRAWLALGISDTQAINKVSQLEWNKNKSVDFEPGTRVTKTLASGFHALLDLSKDKIVKNAYFPFSLNININGSRGFYFSPFGKTTDVTVKSDWPHPSFQGNVLPNTHEVSDSGFKAKWSVPHLARNYPQIWTLETQKFNVNEFSAGVNLFESVSLYS